MCKFIAERIITCQCTNENLGNSLTKRDFRLQSGNLVYKMRFSFTKRDSWVTNGTLALHFTKNREERIKIAKDLMDYAMKSMINQVNKLRISFYAKEGNEVSFLGMYKKLGFEKEAELKDEYENKSLFLYSMFI